MCFLYDYAAELPNDIGVEKQNTLGSYSRNSQISASSKVFSYVSGYAFVHTENWHRKNTHHFVISYLFASARDGT